MKKDNDYSEDGINFDNQLLQNIRTEETMLISEALKQAFRDGFDNGYTEGYNEACNNIIKKWKDESDEFKRGRETGLIAGIRQHNYLIIKTLEKLIKDKILPNDIIEEINKKFIECNPNPEQENHEIIHTVDSYMKEGYDIGFFEAIEIFRDFARLAQYKIIKENKFDKNIFELYFDALNDIEEMEYQDRENLGKEYNKWLKTFRRFKMFKNSFKQENEGKK